MKKLLFTLALIFALLISCEKEEEIEEVKFPPICKIIAPQNKAVYYMSSDGNFWSEEGFEQDYTGAMELRVTAKDIDGYIKSVSVHRPGKTFDITNKKRNGAEYGYYYIGLKRSLGKHEYTVTILDNDNLSWQGKVEYSILKQKY